MKRRKLGRPPAGTEVLSRERILATALRIVDEQGTEALSMRGLARDLGVDPMAIYHHVPGREALLKGVIELVFDKLRVDTAANAGWRDRIRAFARAYRELVRSHPNLVLYLVSNLRAGTEAVLRANEVLYGALDEAGLPPEAIARAADLLVDYLNGRALAEGLQLQGRASEPRSLEDLLASSPPEQFPALRRALSSLPARAEAPKGDDGLEIVLAGITALLGPQAR